jgi:hypothetical protein
LVYLYLLVYRYRSIRIRGRFLVAAHPNSSGYEGRLRMAKTNIDEDLRRQLAALLDGGQAHAKFEDAVANFPVELRGVVPEGLPYSAWQIVEHIRIAQRDILKADLAKPFLWGTGQNLLREALLIADHAAYHTGELIVVRRLLGAWKK